MVGLYTLFPTVTSNFETVPFGFSQFTTIVELAVFDLYGFVNSSFGLLYPS